MKKIWKIYPEDPAKDPLSEKLNIDPLIMQIILNRGITEEEDIKNFLYPNSSMLRNPFYMPDMEKGVHRVSVAIKKREKILIYGDYDVDGITSTSLLILGLQKLGGILSYHIPSRFGEGYGLNKGILIKAYKKNVKLLITVDCGVTSIEEAKLARELGIDIVIIDHHEQGEILPDAIAIIDPKRLDSKYGFREFAGVGVAYKFIEALYTYLKKDTEHLEQYLDLVALGTIADIVPYVDENRYFVKHGLKKINEMRRPAIRALISVSKLDGSIINEDRISFNIAPRINAAGRMSSASPVVRMFLSENYGKVLRWAKFIDRLNIKRRIVENEIFKEALSKIEKDDIDKDRVIVVWGVSWNIGVIGIVASRLAKLLGKPVILISINEDVAQGSGRSVPGISLFDLLNKASDLLLSFGGHEQAVGLKLKSTNLSRFREKIIEKFDELYRDKSYSKVLHIDAKVDFGFINDEFVNQLDLLSPFGIGNSYPVFLLNNVYLTDFNFPRNGNRGIKFKFNVDNKEWKAFGYDFGNRNGEIVSLAQRLDLVFGIKSNFNLDFPIVYLEDFKINDFFYSTLFSRHYT